METGVVHLSADYRHKMNKKSEWEVLSAKKKTVRVKFKKKPDF